MVDGLLRDLPILGTKPVFSAAKDRAGASADFIVIPARAYRTCAPFSQDVIPAQAGTHEHGPIVPVPPLLRFARSKEGAERLMYFVYLLASRRHGTLYIGVTSNLLRRVWEHKAKALPGFTTTYGVDRLVWYESHQDATAAITREKQIKKWRRDWKIALIEADNPDWRDLYQNLSQ